MAHECEGCTLVYETKRNGSIPIWATSAKAQQTVGSPELLTWEHLAYQPWSLP